MRLAPVVTLIAGLAAVLVPAANAAGRLPPPPPAPGTVLGGQTPISVTASIPQPVQFFADRVAASVVVFVDRKWVDPSKVRAVVDFSPYQAVAPPTERESIQGRLVKLTWSWTLNCLTVECVPSAPPSDVVHVFHFQPVQVEVLANKGTVAYGITGLFPELETVSGLSPPMVQAVLAHKRIPWQYQLAPPAASFRLPPGVVFWVALGLALICIAAGLAIAARWAWQFRPAAVASSGPTSSSLERALAVFFWAGGRGDETLQRKALERVAAELPFDVDDLSETTRALAWSPASPAPDEVEEISERAGVPTHNVRRAES
jgi:hypothetical protein